MIFTALLFFITNPLSIMDMPILTYVNEIAPRPMLLITGENAHSRYFSEDIYKAATTYKALIIIPNAVHMDLYDKVEVIPFYQIALFFHKHLKQNPVGGFFQAPGQPKTGLSFSKDEKY